MMNRETGSPVPGSGIGQLDQAVKDGPCDGTEVIMRVMPGHLVDHADRLSIEGRSRVALCHEPRSGNRGADVFDQFEPQVRQITKAEVHFRGISMWVQTLK
jgi:hypothetical protein